MAFDVGGFLGGVATGIGNYFGAREQANAQVKATELNYRNNLDMWNRQNVYNAPAEQMKRLEAAGINPNAVVGHGSIVGNTAGSPPQSNISGAKASAWNSVASAMNVYLDLKNKAAQNDNLVAQNRLLLAQVANASADTSVKLTSAAFAKKDLEIFNSTGIRPNDPFYARIAGRISDSLFPKIRPIVPADLTSSKFPRYNTFWDKVRFYLGTRY